MDEQMTDKWWRPHMAHCDKPLTKCPEAGFRVMIPFGRALQNLLDKGRTPTREVRLYIGGNALNVAKQVQQKALESEYWQPVLAMPEWAPHDKIAPQIIPPDRYKWPVRGMSILGFCCVKIQGDIIMSLREELRNAGATVIVIRSHDGGKSLISERVGYGTIQ